MTINLNTPKIKICGICNVEDAKLAVKYKAQYLGLIFVKSSPRYVEPVVAKSIVDAVSNDIQTVGVFQNSSLEEMENIADLVGFDYFQLHGRESPELCGRLSKPVIKAFQIAVGINKGIVSELAKPHLDGMHDKDPDKDIDKVPANRGSVVGGNADDATCIALLSSSHQTTEDIKNCLGLLEKYKPYCQHFLFDKPKRESSSDWPRLATKPVKLIEKYLPNYFFAGGLNAHNVQTVLNQLHPAVLDIASGIEQNPRKKSEPLLADFCEKVEAQYNDFCVNGSSVSRSSVSRSGMSRSKMSGSDVSESDVLRSGG